MLPSFKSSDHEHRLSLFKFLKFSFSTVSQFSVDKSYFFVKFIPKYFILSDGIVNEVFLHSIVSCSLILYRHN